MPDIVTRMDKTRAALAVTLGVMLLRLPVAWGIGLLLPDPQGDPAIFYAALMLQETLLWGLPALLMLPWRAHRLKVEQKWLGLCMGAALTGLAAQAALMTITPLWTAWTGAGQAAVLLPQNGVQWVLAVLALVVIPAVTEEAFFRGGLMPALCDGFGTGASLLLTTLIFALMHGSLAGFPAHVGISLLCSLSMLCRGRLRIPVVMHMCYNGAALLLRNVPAASLPALPLALIIAACGLWLVGQVIWRRRWREIHWADILLLCVIVLGAAALYLPELI